MLAMNYRRLGRSGLKVSELSLGSWVTYGNQLDAAGARECMAAAWDRGVNFYDNAEVYAGGKSEELMGEALKKLAWPRLKYIVSTKFFWGITDGPNEKATLNRKYLLSAIDLESRAVNSGGKMSGGRLGRDFMADTDAKKRDKLVDKLLDSPEYSYYFGGCSTEQLSDCLTRLAADPGVVTTSTEET